MPVPVRPGRRYHEGHDDERVFGGGSGADARHAAECARTARTVAEHAVDAEDCRILLEMLGLRLDTLRAEQPLVPDPRVP